MFRVLSGVSINFIFFTMGLVFTFDGASSLFSSLELLILWVFLQECRNKKNDLYLIVFFYSPNSFYFSFITPFCTVFNICQKRINRNDEILCMYPFSFMHILKILFSTQVSVMFASHHQSRKTHLNHLLFFFL